MKRKNLIASDIPIKHPDEDLLNYYSFAEKIQKVIQGCSNNPEPLTIEIYNATYFFENLKNRFDVTDSNIS